MATVKVNLNSWAVSIWFSALRKEYPQIVDADLLRMIGSIWSSIPAAEKVLAWEKGRVSSVFQNSFDENSKLCIEAPQLPSSKTCMTECFLSALSEKPMLFNQLRRGEVTNVLAEVWPARRGEVLFGAYGLQLSSLADPKSVGVLLFASLKELERDPKKLFTFLGIEPQKFLQKHFEENNDFPVFPQYIGMNFDKIVATLDPTVPSKFAAREELISWTGGERFLLLTGWIRLVKSVYDDPKVAPCRWVLNDDEFTDFLENNVLLDAEVTCRKVFERLEKNVKREDLLGEPTQNKEIEKFANKTGIRMPLSSDVSWNFNSIGMYGGYALDATINGESYNVDMGDLLLFLLSLTPLTLKSTNCPRELLVLRAVALTAMQLLRSGGVEAYPSWVSGTADLCVLWMPFMQDSNVFQTLKALQALVIRDLDDESHNLGKRRLVILLTGFITQWVLYVAEKNSFNKLLWRLHPVRFISVGNIIGMENRDGRTALMHAASRAFEGLLRRQQLGVVPVVNVKLDQENRIRLALGYFESPRQDLQRRVQPIRNLRRDPARFSAFESFLKCCGDFPRLARFQGKAIESEVELPYEELSEFLKESIYLEDAGIKVNLPQALSSISSPEVIVSARLNSLEDDSLQTKGLLELAELTQFDWRIAVGEKEITLDELKERMKAQGEIVSYGNIFVRITEEKLRSLEATLVAHEEPSVWDKLRALLTGMFENLRVSLQPELFARLHESAAVKDLAEPDGFRGTLRPYQVRGFSWLVSNAMLGVGSLLADDMGLGKTVQLIAAIQELHNRGEFTEGGALIVAPASLLVNWQRELEQFAPDLSAFIYHGAKRELPQERPDVLITSYGILRRDFDKLLPENFRLLVLDEAQVVKNHTSAQAKAVRAFHAKSVIALTGTPVENRLMEYWSIFSAVQPKLLGTQRAFKAEFAKPIEEERSTEALERFRQVTAPFMLRRVKTDPAILKDLPERNVIDHFASLTKAQAVLYADCLKSNLKDLEDVSKIAEESADEATKRRVNDIRMQRRGRVLRMIMHLKQITNSPSQFTGEHVEKPDSGKGEALLELLERCLDADRKTLIFTQFTEMGERLQTWIEKAFGTRPDFLHGGLSINARTAMVDRFQQDPASKILILSLKAGGTGLNLTAASAVIHYDLWWNPAVEDQASDRAWRIGQRRDVVVYRFITAGTFEEKVNRMLRMKRELANLTVGVGESWIGDLSDDEIRSIFSLSKQ